MGFRRRTRRRAVIAGAAVAHHENKKYEEQQAQANDLDQGQEDQGQDDQVQENPGPQDATSAADPAEEIEHLAELHASGALTDEEFAAAKANVLGT